MNTNSPALPRRGRPPELHPDESPEVRARKRAYWRNYYYRLSPRDAWCRAALNNSKRRAKIHGVAHTITLDDVRRMIPDDLLCPILSVPLDIAPNKFGATPTSATIDRIDANGGYTPDNTHIICALANRGKAHMNLDQLIKLGQWAMNFVANPR